MTGVTDSNVYAFETRPGDNNDTFLHTLPRSPVQVLIERAERLARPLPDPRLCSWVAQPFNMSRYIISFGKEDIIETGRPSNASRYTNYVASIIDYIYDSLPPIKAEWSDDTLRTLDDLDAYVDDIEYDEPHTFDVSLTQAKRFFERFSTLLPKRPFMYPTTKGELLAEISNGQWSMTIIFSKKDIIIFSSDQAERRIRIVEEWQHVPSRIVEVLEQELALRES
jgi:hypothetical protein